MIEEFKIPLDEYPRRCIKQIEGWEKEREDIHKDGKIGHERSKEYASYIMEAVVTNTQYKIGGNVLNNGYIDNLPSDACVEVPCYIDGTGVHPVKVGKLPTQLAAMNSSNVSPQLLAIEAAVTKDRQKIYQAAMMDPHTGAELNIKDIQAILRISGYRSFPSLSLISRSHAMWLYLRSALYVPQSCLPFPFPQEASGSRPERCDRDLRYGSL